MSGLTVLLVGPYPVRPYKVTGGVETVLRALAPALAEHEDIAQVIVLCFHHGELASHRAKVTPKLQIWYLRGQDHLALPTSAFLEVTRARRVVAETHPDVAHGQGISTYGHIATHISDSAVVTVHGLILEPHLRPRGLMARGRFWLLDAMVRRVLSRARVVISTSSNDTRSYDGLIRGERVIIPNPVPAEFFEPYDLNKESHDILYAGSLWNVKNVDGIIRAFALTRTQAPLARLTIVGPVQDPLYAARLRDLSLELGLDESVMFRGHVDNAELLHRMRQCNVVVLFSHQENTPIVIAQAMAIGKPVVASNVGGIPDMVRDGCTGFLVDPGSEQMLAQRLTELASSPDLCRRMGRNAREIALQTFTPAAVAQRTVAAYWLAIRK